MATLTVVKFPTANGADDALDTLHRLQSQELIRLHDAAVVTWPPERKKPETHELHDTKKAGALGGAFWGFSIRPDLPGPVPRRSDRRRGRGIPWLHRRNHPHQPVTRRGSQVA
jgi:hypothetical protein